MSRMYLIIADHRKGIPKLIFLCSQLQRNPNSEKWVEATLKQCLQNYTMKISCINYMQTYSIVLSRNSKKSSFDVDHSSLGDGININRCHARIFYDFQCRCFTFEVLGKNGCFINPPVKLHSQDLLQNW
ncbi:hypothetical protein ACS0TY_017325 [Phlomoides rotata]